MSPVEDAYWPGDDDLEDCFEDEYVEDIDDCKAAELIDAIEDARRDDEYVFQQSLRRERERERELAAGRVAIARRTVGRPLVRLRGPRARGARHPAARGGTRVRRGGDSGDDDGPSDPEPLAGSFARRRAGCAR
jgi:hypothetical protein